MSARRVPAAPPDITVVESRAELDRAGASLEPLLERTGAPITAQWWWVRAWFDTQPLWRPLCVVVGDPARPAGGAVLATRRRAGVTEIVPAGFGQSDYPWLPAEPGAAEEVAAAIATAVRAAAPAWRLMVYEAPAGDPVTLALARRFPHHELFPGVGAPVIDLPGYDMRRNISANARKRVRQSRNRLRADGREVDYPVVRSPAELAAVLDEVEAVHVGRDHEARGGSDLDVPEQRAFWRAVLLRAAERGCLEIVTMRVDGELAGHLIGFSDGRAFRVWDARMAPAFARYTPGHLMRDEALTRLLADGRFDVFDWMRGLEPYKLQSSTRVVETVRLRAWSHRLLARGEQLARRALRRPTEPADGHDDA